MLPQKLQFSPSVLCPNGGIAEILSRFQPPRAFPLPAACPKQRGTNIVFLKKIMAGYPDELKKGREWRIFMLKNHGKIVIIHYPYIASVKTKPDPCFKSHKSRFGIRIRIEKYFHERTGRNS